MSESACKSEITIKVIVTLFWLPKTSKNIYFFYLLNVLFCRKMDVFSVYVQNFRAFEKKVLRTIYGGKKNLIQYKERIQRHNITTNYTTYTAGLDGGHVIRFGGRRFSFWIIIG